MLHIIGLIVVLFIGYCILSEMFDSIFRFSNLKTQFNLLEQENAKLKQDLKDQVKKAEREQLHVCPHCNKIGTKAKLARWHFDNCKHKAH